MLLDYSALLGATRHYSALLGATECYYVLLDAIWQLNMLGIVSGYNFYMLLFVFMKNYSQYKGHTVIVYFFMIPDRAIEQL
jgi:hypothetical protein